MAGQMNKQLFFSAMIKYILGLVFSLLLIFLPAGTINYWNGWLFIVVLFVPMFIAGIIMMIVNPELLRKRLNAKETQSEQKLVIIMSLIMFLAAFIVAGLNFRFEWIVLPKWIVFMETGIFLVSYLLYAEVMRENTYLSRTIEIQEKQKVIDTGLYGIVRHPMYAATIFLFLSMPLILGSVISFVIMLFYIPIIAKRMKNEEKVLEKGLEGYIEYKKHVKYKVIPFIW